MTGVTAVLGIAAYCWSRTPTRYVGHWGMGMATQSPGTPNVDTFVEDDIDDLGIVEIVSDQLEDEGD